VVNAYPRHGWSVTTPGGIGDGREVACGRVVGVVAGLGEEGMWGEVVVGVLA